MRDSLVSAFELRQMGDYGSPGSVGKEKVRALMDQAKEFIGYEHDQVHKKA
jgi:hypothetical protein